MSGRGGKRNAVMFAKPDEPAFLRRMKAELGYKESPSIDTKRETLPEPGPDDERDKEDEKPVIVTLKPGDLTHEEVERLGGLKEIENDGPTGKVIFKKPMKRTSPEVSSGDKGTKRDVSPVQKKVLLTNSKGVKNTSLLSFNEDEDDDDCG